MITASRLRSVLQYDPENGLFLWLVDRPRARAGFPAGTINAKSGYHRIKLDGRLYQSHRLAWLYVHSAWPLQLDHINGDKSDFRIANLRPCTQSTNYMNRRRNLNKELPKGVRKRGNRYQARIQVNGKSKWLGTYPTENEAQAAYMTAAHLYFGEFASSGEYPK